MSRESATIQSASKSGSSSVADSHPEQAGVFRREGEYWTVGYRGNTFSLRDTRGLGYLAHLLRHPDAEFHVLDLIGGFAAEAEDDETSRPLSRLPHSDNELEKRRNSSHGAQRRGRDA